MATIDAMEPRVDRITAVPLRSLKKAEEVLSQPGRWRQHPTKPHMKEIEGSSPSERPEVFIATRNAITAARQIRALEKNIARVQSRLDKDGGRDEHGVATGPAPAVGYRLLLTAEDDSSPVSGEVLYNGTVTLNPNTPSVPTGLYYVVAQLDPDDLLVEDDEANNEAIYNQKITVVNGCGGCASGGATRGWALVAGGIGLLRRARRSR